MGQKRLNSLALLCIENELLEKIDTDDIIKSFALYKSKKCVIWMCAHEINTLFKYLFFVSIVVSF